MVMVTSQSAAKGNKRAEESCEIAGTQRLASQDNELLLKLKKKV